MDSLGYLRRVREGEGGEEVEWHNPLSYTNVSIQVGPLITTSLCGHWLSDNLHVIELYSLLGK